MTELKAQAIELLNQWRERYPAVAEFLPLKVGVFDDLMADWPDVKHSVVVAAVAIHVNRVSYLDAMSSDHAWRHDLSGTPIELVTAEHQHCAAIKLAARQAKQQRKADATQDKARKPAPTPPTKATATPPAKPTVSYANGSRLSLKPRVAV